MRDLMLSAQRLLLFFAWLTGIAFTLIGAFVNHPFLLALRGPKTAAVFVAGFLAVALLTKCGFLARRPMAGGFVAAAAARGLAGNRIVRVHQISRAADPAATEA